MILEIEHFYQKTGYTCAPAALRMVLSALELEIPSEEDIEKILKTDPETGTKYEDLLEAAKHYGVQSFHKQHGTIEILDSLIEEGYIILIGYHFHVPHAAIYLGSDEYHIYLHDPSIGPTHQMTKEKFMSDWEIDPKRFHWYLAEYQIDWPEEQSSKQWYMAFKK